MSHVTAVTSTYVPAPMPPIPVDGQAVERAAEPVTAGWPEDRVDITGMTVDDAMMVVETVRVEAIRRQIASGAYLTEDKLKVVVERLFELLRAKRIGAGEAT